MERIRPNDPQAWIYFDVLAVDESGDEDVIVEEHERVTVTMGSDADHVILKDVNGAEVARFTGRDDEEGDRLTHAAFFRAGIEILNVLTSEGRDVILELRPHQDFPMPNT